MKELKIKPLSTCCACQETHELVHETSFVQLGESECTIADIFTSQKDGSRCHSPLRDTREGIYSGDISGYMPEINLVPMWQYPGVCDIDKDNGLMWKSCESSNDFMLHMRKSRRSNQDLSGVAKQFKVSTALQSVRHLCAICSCSRATCRPLMEFLLVVFSQWDSMKLMALVILIYIHKRLAYRSWGTMWNGTGGWIKGHAAGSVEMAIFDFLWKMLSFESLIGSTVCECRREDLMSKLHEAYHDAPYLALPIYAEASSLGHHAPICKHVIVWNNSAVLSR